MHCPRLSELPPPPSGKTGWPWTEESWQLPNTRPNGDPWPLITVVTPSLNKGKFIEETIRSVLLQGYPNLEYFVFDGASTDNSVEIIKKYSPWLGYWSSEPDSGQSSAINRGLQMGSGLFATWINSDDMLFQNAIVNHAFQIGFAPNVVYVGICRYIDEAGNHLFTHQGRVYSFEDLVRVGTVWRSGGCIVQPETFFPRELAISVGGVNENLHFSMDFELWGKFFLAGAKFEYSMIPIGISRKYGGQKINDELRTTQEIVKTASRLTTLNDRLSDNTKIEIQEDLEAYNDMFRKMYWKRKVSYRKIRSGLRKLANSFMKFLS